MNSSYESILNLILQHCKEENMEPESIREMMRTLELDVMKRVLVEKGLVYVLKKDNTLEPFNISKIKKSIIGAAEDINWPLTEGDIQTISRAIHDRILKLKDLIIPSYSIALEVMLVLEELSFKDLYISYRDFEKSKRR